LLAGFPNVTSDRKLTNQLKADYVVGKNVTVYVDAKSPNKSSLQTVKDFGWKAVVMLFFLLFIAGLFVFGVMYFKKMMNG